MTMHGLSLFSAFQSTLSVRRATVGRIDDYRVGGISIHALREESDAFAAAFDLFDQISIHALREESDTLIRQIADFIPDFNPRSP